mmetsp:Transcript_60715/g.131577  ORF Transcript_60715/g.131577 Transcript_60715/m.131577 type:complete len:246 (+) Transcript_60715:155-892(+)
MLRLERCSRREIKNHVLVVLREGLVQPLCPPELHRVRVGLVVHVDHLRPHVLQGQQREARSAERRLHPSPSPGANLQHSFEVLLVWDSGGDEDLIEPHGSRLVEDHGEAAESRDQATRHANLVRERRQPETLSALSSNLLHDVPGSSPLYLVDPHDISHQALGACLVVAVLGEDDESLVGQLAHEGGHVYRILQSWNPQGQGLSLLIQEIEVTTDAILCLDDHMRRVADSYRGCQTSSSRRAEDS